MTAQEVLCQYVDKYRELSSRYGESSKRVTEAFCKLRELLLVELYFMKPLRILVNEEELSGFVIYIEGKLRGIVDAYQPGQSSFMPYFRHVMEYRALSYLEENRRRNYLALAYERYYLNHAEEVAECSPEDAYLDGIERLELERKRRTLMDRLRSMCACKPSRRRNLFILLCSLMPYLSTDAIDDFCRELNCNRDQTFAIAEYLRYLPEGSYPSRGSRLYIRSRLDYLWARRMEMEYAFDHSDGRNACLSESIRKITALITQFETDGSKMNVEYPVLGKILNLEPCKIAYAIYSSKKLLSVVIGDDRTGNGYIVREARATSGRKSVELKRLDPFSDFGITCIKTERYADAS